MQTLSANRSSTIFDVCERLVPLRAVAVHTIPVSFSCRHEGHPLYNEHNLGWIYLQPTRITVAMNTPSECSS